MFKFSHIFYLLITIIIFKNNLSANNKNFINDVEIFNQDQTINVVIEIPAGTIEKWEIGKDGIKIEHEISEGKLRKIDYLPYPFNYGFIPQTLLPLDKKGDGDPLDVIIIGPSIERGSIIKVKPIGAILVLDNGKIDTKIITLSLNKTNLSKMNTINDIKKNYIGLFDIILVWLKNYKGEVVEIKGMINKQASLEYIQKYHLEFKNKK